MRPSPLSRCTANGILTHECQGLINSYSEVSVHVSPWTSQLALVMDGEILLEALRTEENPTNIQLLFWVTAVYIYENISVENNFPNLFVTLLLHQIMAPDTWTLEVVLSALNVLTDLANLYSLFKKDKNKVSVDSASLNCPGNSGFLGDHPLQIHWFRAQHKHQQRRSQWGAYYYIISLHTQLGYVGTMGPQEQGDYKKGFGNNRTWFGNQSKGIWQYTKLIALASTRRITSNCKDIFHTHGQN